MNVFSSFLNTIVGRLLALLIIVLLTKNNTTYGLLAVFAFILLSENANNLNNLIEGQENMDKSDGPTKEEIDAFNKEINKKINPEEIEKGCKKFEGEPDAEALDIYKKSMFNGSNSISASEFMIRLFTQNNPYYKHYEKKHGSMKLLNDTIKGIMGGCYDGYAMKVSLEQPKSVDDSLKSTGSAVSGLLSGF
jgi:hypothetical protein